MVELAKEYKMDNVKLVVGGIIPPDDVLRLKELGVKEVYTPGTPKDVIIEGIKACPKGVPLKSPLHLPVAGTKVCLLFHFINFSGESVLKAGLAPSW